MNEEPAADGTQVVVELNGTGEELARTTVQFGKDGYPGGYSLDIPLDDPDTPEVEGLNPEDKVDWKLNGILCYNPAPGSQILGDGDTPGSGTQIEDSYNLFAIGDSEVKEDEPAAENGATGNTGGSSGSGGAGGGSPEPATNVDAQELAQQFVSNGNCARFEFKEGATAVSYVEFDPKKSLGKITARVEMLKGQSVLVPEPPEGEVYKNINIWVGNEGTASPENIENAVIGFRVAKSWVIENNLIESSIQLWRFDGDRWNPLPTEKIGEDTECLYFEAETPGFSPFSIVCNKGYIEPEEARETINKIGEEQSGTGNFADNIEGNLEGPETESSAPAIGILPGFVLFLIAAALFKKK